MSYRYSKRRFQSLRIYPDNLGVFEDSYSLRFLTPGRKESCRVVVLSEKTLLRLADLFDMILFLNMLVYVTGTDFSCQDAFGLSKLWAVDSFGSAKYCLFHNKFLPYFPKSLDRNGTIDTPSR